MLVGVEVAALPWFAALAACSSTAPPPGCLDAPAACRARCGYGSGDLAADTLGDEPLLGDRIPIDLLGFAARVRGRLDAPR